MCEGPGSVKNPRVWKADWRWPFTLGQPVHSLSHTFTYSKSSGICYPGQRRKHTASRGDLVHHLSHIAELQRRWNCNKMFAMLIPFVCFFSPFPQTDNVSKRLHTSSVNLCICASGWRHVHSSTMPQRQSAHGCLRWLCSSSWKTKRCGSTTPAANKRVALHFI